MKTVFLRALDAEDKAKTLQRAIRGVGTAQDGLRFDLDPTNFAAVPNSPFAYWVSDALRQLFGRFPPFEGSLGTAKQGVATSDDFRFVRAWWEVQADHAFHSWFPFTKGGGASGFYSDTSLSLNWQLDGKEVKVFAEATPGTTHWSRNIRSTEFYFRAGFSWALRTSRFAPYCVPAQCIFSVSRYQAFTDEQYLLATIGLLNSSTCTALLRMSSEWFSRPKFIIGIVQSLPVPSLTASDATSLGAAARRAWSIKRSLDTRTESSHAFLLPALLQVDGYSLAARANAWTIRVQALEAELDAIQADIDVRAFDLYGIDEADRRAITEGFATSRGKTHERRNGRGVNSRGRFVVMGLLLLKERLGVFHRSRTASVSAL